MVPREGKGGGNKGLSVVAKNPTDFYNALHTVESYLIDYETGDLDKKHLMAVRNEIGKNLANRKDWLLLIGRVVMALDPVFTENEKMIQTILANERDEINKEHTDKTEAAA